MAPTDVESGGRFIQQKDGRPLSQRPREQRSAPFATAEPRRGSVREMAQAHSLQRIAGCLSIRFGLLAQGSRCMEAPLEGDVSNGELELWGFVLKDDRHLSGAFPRTPIPYGAAV